MVLQQWIGDGKEGEMNHGSRALHFLSQKWSKFKFYGPKKFEGPVPSPTLPCSETALLNWIVVNSFHVQPTL
jgi:hypothetical protein